MQLSQSQATRYLCVAAYLDRTFAHELLDAVLGLRARLIATTPGADLGLVTRHCLAARRRLLGLDLARLVLMAVGILTAAGASVLRSAISLGLISIPFIAWRGRSAPSTGGHRSILTAATSRRGKRARASTWPRGWYLALPAGGILLLVPSISPTRLIVLLGALGTVVLVTVAHELDIRFRVVGGRLSEKRFPTCAAPWVGRRTHERLQALTAPSNVITYRRSDEHSEEWRKASRGSALFLGLGRTINLFPPYGVDLDRRIHEWSQPEQVEPCSFELTKLVDTVRDAILGAKLPGHAISDVLLFSLEQQWKDARLRDPRTGRPVRQVEVDDQLMKDVMLGSVQDAWHYLCVQVMESQWSGNLVVYLLVNFWNRGSHLSIQFVTNVVYPIKDEYLAQAERYELRPLHPKDLGPAVWAGISAGVGEAITAPIAVLTTSWSMALEWLARRIPPRLREPRPAHHAPFVLREIVATNSIPSEAQRLDYFRYRIKVEKLLVDTIERYLDGLGIDTSTLREQSGNVIYNLGVMQGAGAAFNNDSGTVVAGPNAHLMRPPPPTQAAGGTPPPAGR